MEANLQGAAYHVVEASLKLFASSAMLIYQLIGYHLGMSACK